MSPRRAMVTDVLVPRPLRRGIGGAVSGNKLTITGSPGLQFRSGIAGGGATIRLQTAAGLNVLLAGVVVTVMLGQSGAALAASPALSVATDASGIATFTSFTLTGVAGTYDLVFSAPGYTGATDAGHELIAGTPVASQTTATVPSGVVGSTTTILVQARDAQGNPLTLGGASVTVQITGTNAQAQSAATDLGTGVYRFTYVPGAAGTDAAVIRLGGTAISGSPYTSTVTTSGGSGAFGPNSMPVGLANTFGNEIFALGPAVSGGVWTSTEPIYRMVNGISDASNIVGDIAVADSKNILMVVNLAHSRSNWLDANGVASLALYKAEIDSYDDRSGSSLIYNAVASALARRRMVVYGMDEPQIISGATPLFVRDAFVYIKLKWPNSIMVARMEPNIMRGWNGVSVPVGYFDKLDYACSTYRGNSHSSSGPSGRTPTQVFADGKAQNLANGYGTFYSMNWINLGDNICWDYLNTGSSSGRIHADTSTTGQAAQGTPCSTSTSETEWMGNPAQFRAVGAAAAADADCPFLNCWTHVYPGFSNQAFKPYEQRSDMVAALQAMIRSGEQRATWNGWRTPK